MARGIAIEDVSKTYDGSRNEPVLALTPTDLTLRPGEFFSLVGPSGCGKSTLLNMVAGLLPPSTGVIRIGGEEITQPQRSTGIVFQNATLLRWLTVRENILLPAKIGGKSLVEARRLAEHYLDIVGLSDAADRYPAELSGGMQQRASIVRALVSDPEVLLMDEPFSALDEFTRETLQDEMLRLWTERPKTVLFITHNIAEAAYLSDRVGVMSAHPGRLDAIVEIPLGRPRTPDIRSESTFFEIVAGIRTQIGPHS
ncbi:ABC transporter ATP-binding protein [Saccharomonospora sp. NPDC046836]|uniref:ABC transporter ATP-binding protein n=1 Tax=Saccharomonospora sp. NPDC046836 TaxID=3156921 RepID=UPI0033D933BE